MADFGLTDEGYNLKRLDQIKTDIESDLISVFGDNLNLSPESPDGQVVGILAESFANLWELGEHIYNAFNPNASAQFSLSNLVEFNGILRQEAVGSIAGVSLNGTPGTVIPAGSLISTSDTQTQFTLDEAVTLDAFGVGSVLATAVETGPLEAVAGTLTTIETPVTGWDTVTNPEDAVIGQDREKDPELRARRTRSVARDAVALVDAIFAEVAAVDAVTNLQVLENDTNMVDANGLPAHSIQVIVRGGVDQDIAQAIFLKKTVGITSVGTTTVVAFDSQGLGHPIRFTRPKEINIFMEINLTTFANYPADGDDQIKQAIIDYAAGELVEGREFSVGDDVIYSRLYTPINSVIGHQIDSMFIGLTSSPAVTSNLAIDIDEIAQFAAVNIAVNHS